ncbi:MAG: hypothetical protein FWG55_03765 [Candidatus Bathyarchaeota archaeon]|nr:hypothetical protein [Candidatus Termiticorpusculum sp.]
MKWKNVYYLVQIERKSGRLLNDANSTRYNGSHLLDYWPYWLSVGIGVVVGVVAWALVSSLSSAVDGEIQNIVARFFVMLPTCVLILGIISTLSVQIKRGGVKMQAEAPYWLPITWQEHTLASVLTSLLGLPLCVVLFMVSAILMFSVFTGFITLALITSVALFTVAFLSSTLTEILRVLQVRFIGAVCTSSGRGVIWVRFIGSLVFFLFFYVIYFTFISYNPDFFLTLTDIQNSLFYVPFVWLGLMLSNFFLSGGSVLLGIVYLILSISFIGSMYALAVLLNKHFGLYEPPAIRVQKSGSYTPKTGILGKFGFSTNEIALIRKDIKAFTRRRELITVFLMPLVITLMPIMQAFRTPSYGVFYGISLISVGMVYLFPASLMVYLLGGIIMGEEGQAVWRIYASPISAKNLVKSKYFLTVLFGLIMLVATGVLGTIIYKPSITIMCVGLLESFFLIIALGAISVNIGFRGADFTEIPRPRMVRGSWVLIGFVACFLSGLAILAPIVPTVLSSIVNNYGLGLDPFVATVISGVIAVIITVIFYKFALNSAKNLLMEQK